MTEAAARGGFCALASLAGPCALGLSLTAIRAIAHLADAAEASIVLRSIDNERNGATSADKQREDARAMVRRATR